MKSKLIGAYPLLLVNLYPRPGLMEEEGVSHRVSRPESVELFLPAPRMYRHRPYYMAFQNITTRILYESFRPVVR